MMREGRWRELDATAAADGRWPGADRRRATVDEAARGGQQLAAGAKRPDRAAEHIEPEREVSTASTAATAYRYDELDDDDRSRFGLLVAVFGIDPVAVAPEFHVGRTRRGYVLMLTEYELDDRAQPVYVLGQPVVRHHLQPVGVDELPVVCRSERAQ